MLALRERALELISLLERKNEDAIICENKKVRDLAKWNEEIVLSSDIALVARSYLDVSSLVTIGFNAKTNVTLVMNGELFSTTSSLIMCGLRLGIAHRPVITLFSLSLSLIFVSESNSDGHPPQWVTSVLYGPRHHHPF